MNTKKRIVALDTETTGMNFYKEPYINHRLIEIGAVEIIKRRFTGNNFHVYIKPDRKIDSEALKVHGITDDFLSDKPFFKDIADQFLKYIQDSELIIHNAMFDVGFINQELYFLNKQVSSLDTMCSIIDTLKIARKLFPGKKNTLDALCIRYKIKKSPRDLHSAILDAHLLGRLYLLMTGGQESMFVNTETNKKNILTQNKKKKIFKKSSLRILKTTEAEITAHKQYLAFLKKNRICLWN
jgi:DNA polymerase-3 subunit epsilon